MKIQVRNYRLITTGNKKYLKREWHQTTSSSYALDPEALQFLEFWHAQSAKHRQLSDQLTANQDVDKDG